MSTRRRRATGPLATAGKRPRNRQATEEALQQARVRVREAEQLLARLLAAADAAGAGQRPC